MSEMRENAQIRSNLLSVFSRIRTVRIQSECGEIRTRNHPVFGHFSASQGINISKKFGIVNWKDRCALNLNLEGLFTGLF